MQPRHMSQPDDISCGPSVLWMTADDLLSRRDKRNAMKILHVREMMGTNDKVGTTEKEMSRGLSAFGISHERILPEFGASERLETIKDWLSSDNLALLRIMKDGYRHWVLVRGIDTETNSLRIADPLESHDILVPLSTINGWMAPRGYEWWAIPGNSKCHDLRFEHLADEDGNELPVAEHAINLAARTFGPHVPEDFDFREYFLSVADLKTSLALVGNDGIIGCYFLAPRKPSETAEMEEYDPEVAEPLETAFAGLHGVEGVGLAVWPELRGLGYGRLLRAMPGELGFEYAYGLQLKSLENIDDWRKIRDVVVDLGSMYMSGGLVRPLRPMNIAENSTAQTAEFQVEQPSIGFKP